MPAQVMKPTMHDMACVSNIDKFVRDQEGRIRARPAQDILDINPLQMRLWMHIHGVYGFPTTELIEHLKNEFGTDKAIEIGAGTGAFRDLGIPMTDSHLQMRPDVALMYAMTGQPTIRYGDDVLDMEATQAVFILKPDVVFGSWITQLSSVMGEGSSWGVDEEWMLARVHRYFMFGSLEVHGKKKIMALEHQELSMPWMISRSEKPVLFTWKGSKS